MAQVNGTILGQEGDTCAWLKESWTRRGHLCMVEGELDRDLG